MKSSTYWKAVLLDREDFLDRVIELLGSSGIRYCVVGGTGVNAYTDPVVTEDLDIVVASDQIEALEAHLSGHFKADPCRSDTAMRLSSRRRASLPARATS